MASAGRILIMPKGEWKAETEYEMLDLVTHNGASWLAKKNAKGIEPSEANAEYWHNFVDFDKTEYANKCVPSAENNTVDPNITTLARVRTKHANCPDPDNVYVIDTIFVDEDGEIYEKYQYARGVDDSYHTRYKGYNGVWTPWEQVARGGSFMIEYNPSGTDYIDYSFKRTTDGLVKVFANAAGEDVVFVKGTSVTNYVGDQVSIRIFLSQALDRPIYLYIGYIY